MLRLVRGVTGRLRRRELSLNPTSPTVALLPWGNVIEDFLDTIDISLDTFCDKFTGSYMFGYIDALQRAGVRVVLICVSSRVSGPSRFTHAPTGATIWVLRAPTIYRVLQRWMRNPYGRSVDQVFGEVRGLRFVLFPLLLILREVVLYLTTPLRHLANVLRDEGCSVILCQEYEYPRFDVCVALGRLMGLPVFATFQGGDHHRSRLERFVRPLTVRACAGLIVGASTEIERVQAHYRLGRSRMAQIFNPVDVERWNPIDRDAARSALGIPSDAKLVAWHGRVSIHQKGLDVLLEAWQRLCTDLPGDVRLLLLGTGTDAEELQRGITSMQLRGVMWVNEFVSEQDTIRRYLSCADVYAFPSRHEGFPVAPIEAMCCGLPVVAAAAPGVSDIFEGGEASGGLIVRCGDAEALALGIRRLLQDESWGREMGRRARRRAEVAFSLDSVGAQLTTFLSHPCRRNLKIDRER